MIKIVVFFGKGTQLHKSNFFGIIYHPIFFSIPHYLDVSELLPYSLPDVGNMTIYQIHTTITCSRKLPFRPRDILLHGITIVFDIYRVVTILTNHDK